MRVILLTSDPSLGVALAFDDPDREIVSVNSISEARAHDLSSFDVAVVDVHSCTRAERIADLLVDNGVARCLLVGNTLDGDPDAGGTHPHLERPFTMVDFETALADLVRPGRSSPRTERPTTLVGRLFEIWMSGRGSANPPKPSATVSAVGAPDAARSSTLVQILPHDPGRDPDRAAVEDVARMQQHRALLDAVETLGQRLETDPWISDLEGIVGQLEDVVTDELAAASVSVWLHETDGSHVRVGRRDRTSDGPTRLDADHALVELLANEADVVVDGVESPLLLGIEDNGSTGAVAASLRTPGAVPRSRDRLR